MEVKRVRETTVEFLGLGERIKEARKRDSRSLIQICKEAGISRSYWYQIENEDVRSPVTEEMIRKIETVLEVDLGVKFE